MTYEYEAMSTKGNYVTGEIEAECADDCLRDLRSMNLFPTKIKPKKGKPAKAGKPSFNLVKFFGDFVHSIFYKKVESDTITKSCMIERENGIKLTFTLTGKAETVAQSAAAIKGIMPEVPAFEEWKDGEIKPQVKLDPVLNVQVHPAE